MDIVNIISLTLFFFMILNPFASLPMFLNITKGLDDKTVVSFANRAVIVATVLLFFFMFTGEYLMFIFGISLASFQVAGGILFLMMSMELVFGLKLNRTDSQPGAKWTVIASPVLTGPGVITVAILCAANYGLVPVMISGSLALLFTWVILVLSPKIIKVVGPQAISIVSKIIGLFIAARGVESIFAGSLTWFTENAAVAMMMML